MRLLLVEHRRLAKRRMSKYLLAICVLLFALVAGIVYVKSEKIGPAEIAAAHNMANREYDSRVEDVRKAKDRCLKAQASGTSTNQNCAEIQSPSRDDIEDEWYLPHAFDFKKEFKTLTIVFVAILSVAAFLIGASFVGAEWSSGGMTNLIIQCPRRIYVFFVKLLALLSGIFFTTLALGIIWTGAFWYIAKTHGTVKDMTAGIWRSIFLTQLRGVGLILVAAAIGFALASIGRRTATALGFVVAVVAIGQVGLSVVLSIMGARFADAFLMTTYAYAWMMRRFEIQNWESCESTINGMCEPERVVITWQQSGLLFGGITVAFVLCASLLMRHRDIT